MADLIIYGQLSAMRDMTTLKVLQDTNAEFKAWYVWSAQLGHPGRFLPKRIHIRWARQTAIEVMLSVSFVLCCLMLPPSFRYARCKEAVGPSQRRLA